MLDQISRLCLVLFMFILIYGLIIYIRPEISFNNNHNCLRQFGVGYKNTTITPLWLISILVAIISYFTVLYILHIRYNCIFLSV